MEIVDVLPVVAKASMVIVIYMLRWFLYWVVTIATAMVMDDIIVLVLVVLNKMLTVEISMVLILQLL